MPVMRVGRPSPKPVAAAKPVENLNEQRDLADALETAGALVGWGHRAFRRVEAVSATHVVFEFGGLPVALGRSLLPRELVAGQWVRFERVQDGVSASIDLEATLNGESRLTDLFQVLVR